MCCLAYKLNRKLFTVSTSTPFLPAEEEITKPTGVWNKTVAN